MFRLASHTTTATRRCISGGLGHVRRQSDANDKTIYVSQAQSSLIVPACRQSKIRIIKSAQHVTCQSDVAQLHTALSGSAAGFTGRRLHDHSVHLPELRRSDISAQAAAGCCAGCLGRDEPQKQCNVQIQTHSLPSLIPPKGPFLPLNELPPME